MSHDPPPVQTLPTWAEGAIVVETYDADAMLDDGVAPVGPVLQRARSLAVGEVLLVQATFAPSPLVARAAADGHQAELIDDGDGQFRVYIGATAPG